MSGRYRPRQVFLCYLVGVLLVQVGWIFAMPPYRGIDEFDHAFKAAAVARGEWTSAGPAENGRGGLVRIPGSIVNSASTVCRYYDYTGPDNCMPVRQFPDGDVTVASAASSYNPVYYLITGTLARPFGGQAFDYVLRALTALLCGINLAWAAALIGRWARSVWPFVTFSLGLTPMLLESTMIAAPNGVTYASAVLVWSAVIALARGDEQRPAALVSPSVIGGLGMVVTHTTGPMWLLTIALASVLLRPRRHWFMQLRRNPAVWSAAAVTVVIVTMLSITWVRYANTNALGEERLGKSTSSIPWLSQHVLWLLQGIGAFPARNEQAPVIVYVLWGLPLLGLLWMLVARARPRERLAVGALLVAAFAIPTALTLISYASTGLAWQGRYVLPIWVGLTAIGGMVLDREPWLRPFVAHTILVLLAFAMAVSAVNVGLREAQDGPLPPAAAMFTGGFLIVGALTSGGVLSPLWLRRRRGAASCRADMATVRAMDSSS